jgi:hypothetical protein
MVTSNGAAWVTSDELSEARRWMAAKVEGKTVAPPDEGYLMVYTRSGAVQRNGIDGYPLRLVDKAYHRGLYFPSVGRVAVHLPSAGESFEAVVGVDSNDLSYYSTAGRGTIIASVEVSGKEPFRSGVLRDGMAGVSVAYQDFPTVEWTVYLKNTGTKETPILEEIELLPGEEVCTPLMVMQFYKGDWLRAQNTWRRWMLAYNLPRPRGKLPPPQFAGVSTV